MCDRAAFLGLTAQHAHLVVEAHPELALLVPVPTHQAHFRAALHHLPQRLDADIWVVLGSALQGAEVFGSEADLLSSSEDVAVGFKVSSVGPRRWEVRIEPLGPCALWLAGGGPRRGPLICSGCDPRSWGHVCRAGSAVLCGRREGCSGPGSAGFACGRLCGPRCGRGCGLCSANVHHLTAQDPDLVVVADGGQLVFVPANQPHVFVTDQVLPQCLQWGVGKDLCPAFHVLGLCTEFITFGSQILKTVKISTVPPCPWVAAINPHGPGA